MSDGPYDAIVIGGGLGGLSAGAKLAKEGERVLLLEQGAVAGGCATTFHRLDVDFEVSLHELGGFAEGDLHHRIYEDLGILDAIELVPLPEFYRFRHGETDVVVPHDVEGAIDAYSEAFPSERTAVERFFEVITKLRSELLSVPRSYRPRLWELPRFALGHPTLVRHRNATVGEFLDSLTDDEELKMALSANYGYYHDDPYALALAMFAIGQATYYTHGGYYIRGGSQVLSDHLVSVIESNGGTVELGRLATDILVEDDQAVGVRHEATDTGADPRAENGAHVIANCAVPNVAEELLPVPYGEQLREEIADLEPGPSLLMLYLAFDPTPAALGNEHYSTFVVAEEVESLAAESPPHGESYGRRGFVFTDYSQIDAALTPEGKGVGTVVTFDYMANWTGLTDEEYEQKKSFVERVLTRRLGELVPGIEDAIVHAELATPRTIRRFTRNPGGEPYGFAQIPSQTFEKRNVRSPLPNLSFASAWTNPGGGYGTTMASGYWAALDLLEDGE
jgi:phytoene dehydrogenase-like protein